VQKDKTEEEEAQNPAFDLWKAQEQQVLSYLLMSVSHDILVHVAALPSAAEVWKNIKTLFASQSRAWVINTSMALATTQKGLSTVDKYFSKMKSLANDMASAGKKLDDEELNSYVLAGLDFYYNSVVSSIAARVEPISLGELYSQLLAYETRLDLQGSRRSSQSLVNNAMRGRGGFSRVRGGRGRGDFNGGSRLLQ
jgi:hypothetical protein